jgi:hypothetical protein
MKSAAEIQAAARRAAARKYLASARSHLTVAEQTILRARQEKKAVRHG